MKIYRVLWDAGARESLRLIVLYIKEESPAAAIKVRSELLNLTSSLTKMPERFSVEAYLEIRGNEYRSITKWNYKIIYRVLDRCVFWRLFILVEIPRSLRISGLK